MQLSIIIPDSLDLPDHQDGHSPFGGTPTLTDDTSGSSAAHSDDGDSLSEWLSCQSHRTDSPGTSPSSTPSQTRMAVPSRKASTTSLPIFNRPPPPVPPVIRWTSAHSPTSSSCTLVGSLQDQNKHTDDAADCGLRIQLQTYLDENKLANRSVTIDSAVSQCAVQKGFQDYPSPELGGSFHQLLTHATMLDFASEQSNYEGLSEIVRGLDRGIDEFLKSLDQLPFELRNMESFISATSDILRAKSALLGAAGQLTAEANVETLNRTVKCCQHERDMLLRAIRVFFDIADFESRLQAKLSHKPNNDIEPSPKRRFKFKIPRRLSTHSRRSRLLLPEPPPVPSPGKSESDGNATDEDDDDYVYHVAMVSDILTPRASNQYWGVHMPTPRLDMCFSKETGSMQGASLESLVYMLTDPQPRRIPNGIDIDDLSDTFLLCFRSFCDPVALAKALISRLEEQPVGLNNSQRESWPLYRSLVKSRVLSFINTWIDQYWMHEKDRIAGLHIKSFFSPTDDQFEHEEREEIIRKLTEQREMAISLAPSGVSADQPPPEQSVKSSIRVACRQKPIQYKGRLQARVEKLARRVRQPAPTDDEVLSAKVLDDLISSSEGGMHILILNSRELCQQLARQLALFMSEGYLRVVPEDLWYRFGLGHDCDVDTARSTQQAYENALSSWVTGSILDQAEGDNRAAVMTFFIALGLRSHEYHNYSGMRGICVGLTHPCLAPLSEARLPLSEPARLALERLSKLKENVDSIALDGKGVSVFSRPAVPAMEWYFNKLGTAINAKPLIVSPNFSPIPNIERCFDVASIVREMEHWHVSYDYPRADHAQAWLLKCLEGAIARDVDRESYWMFRQSEAIEQTGRPEPTKQNLKLPRLSNPFGKKNVKADWKEATIFELVPELEP